MAIPNGRWRPIVPSAPNLITDYAPQFNEVGFTLYFDSYLMSSVVPGPDIILTSPSGRELHIPFFRANVQPLIDERTGQVLLNERTGQILLGSPGSGFGYYMGMNPIVGRYDARFAAYPTDMGILTEAGIWTIAFVNFLGVKGSFPVGLG